MAVLVPVITATLGAKPELAAQIMRGLTPPHPIYERVGGVIRHKKTGEIVTWLRTIDTQQIDWSSLTRLGPLMQLSAATSLLNLSVTSVGLTMVMQRLATIEQKLDGITVALEEINRKLDLSYYANFRAALELARSAFAMKDEANRRASAALAINRFLEAKLHYLGLLDMELQAGTIAVSPFLNTLALIFVTMARCYLELEEVETARHQLQDAGRDLAPRLKQFYEAVIAVNPAIYLHPALADSISLERLTRMLRYEQPDLTETAAFELLRPSLWETAGQEPDAWLRKLPEALWQHQLDSKKKVGPIKQSYSREEKLARLLPRLPEGFAQVEQAIETLQCINGFQTELDYLLAHKLSFADWQQLQLPQPAVDDPLILVIPQESELLA